MPEEFVEGPIENIHGAQAFKNKDCHRSLQTTLETFRFCKPKDRSDLDRVYSITITELEKALAYFSTYA